MNNILLYNCESHKLCWCNGVIHDLLFNSSFSKHFHKVLDYILHQWQDIDCKVFFFQSTNGNECLQCIMHMPFELWTLKTLLVNHFPIIASGKSWASNLKKCTYVEHTTQYLISLIHWWADMNYVILEQTGSWPCSSFV